MPVAGALAVPPLATTESQRFVQETPGRALPLFGYDLFTAGAFPSLQNVPVPTDYVLGPGDEIDLKLWGAVDADLRLAVDRNGNGAIDNIGELFGGRDHTTVLHAVRKIGSERQQLTELNQQLHVLEQTLKG